MHFFHDKTELQDHAPCGLLESLNVPEWGSSAIIWGLFRESRLLGLPDHIWHLHRLPKHPVLPDSCVSPWWCNVHTCVYAMTFCELLNVTSSLFLVRFDYCRFIELDYVPMETGYMVSMRPTKGYASTKSPTKGYASTKSPDRHSRPTNSPSTPRSRSVLTPPDQCSEAWEDLWAAPQVFTLWCHIVEKSVVFFLCRLLLALFFFCLFCMFPAVLVFTLIVWKSFPWSSETHPSLLLFPWSLHLLFHKLSHSLSNIWTVLSWCYHGVSSDFAPGGLQRLPAIEIPMETRPSAAAATQAPVKAATAAPLKGEATSNVKFEMFLSNHRPKLSTVRHGSWSRARITYSNCANMKLSCLP